MSAGSLFLPRDGASILRLFASLVPSSALHIRLLLFVSATGPHRWQANEAPALLIVVGVALLAMTLFRAPLPTVFTLGVLLICPLLMLGIHGDHGKAHTPAAHDVRGLNSGAGYET